MIDTFKKIDKDGNGLISKTQFIQAFSKFKKDRKF